MREIINTPGAPGSPLYSQGVVAGDHIYLSGLVGIDVSTGALAGPSIEEQTRQALTNCRTVLAEAGATLDDVVEVGILLASPEDFTGMNAEYAAWFPENPPARYVAKLGAVIPGVLVSIRMTAHRGGTTSAVQAAIVAEADAILDDQEFVESVTADSDEPVSADPDATPDDLQPA